MKKLLTFLTFLVYFTLLLGGSLLLGAVVRLVLGPIAPIFVTDPKALVFAATIVVCGAWGWYFSRVIEWIFSRINNWLKKGVTQ